jgi:hypothetical protein
VLLLLANSEAPADLRAIQELIERRDLTFKPAPPRPPPAASSRCDPKRRRLMTASSIVRLLSLISALACFADTRELHASPPSPEAAKEAARLAYEGHRAIESEEWLAAAGHFRKLERLQRKVNEPADAALYYWQAYASA